MSDRHVSMQQDHVTAPRSSAPAERKAVIGFVAALLLRLVAAVLILRAGPDFADSPGMPERGRHLTLAALVLSFVIASGTFAVLVRAMRRATAARAKSEHALHEADRLLDSSIESVPEMVFVKDTKSLKVLRVALSCTSTALSRRSPASSRRSRRRS